ncbi:MAG: peroxide stress protein YaaA [Rhodobacteraceae bacterium]|nr:peroxide stress protein YaaA [Paracoccaceae bacterium]
MLVVLSPAKRLDMSPTPAALAAGTPRFASRASVLAAAARAQGAEGLAQLMGLSDKLAHLNAERFAAFSDDPAPEVTRPAALVFAGDTYAGLEARSLSPDAWRWAGDRLRILSGLYGLLRPGDAIQPYRLEMAPGLAAGEARDLYAFWGDSIARALAEDAAAAGTDTLLNCASVEYFSAVDTAALGLRVIAPAFLDVKDGQARVISFHAKRARGAMARFVMERRIETEEGLADFDTGGYRHRPEMSEPGRPVFLRDGT